MFRPVLFVIAAVFAVLSVVSAAALEARGGSHSGTATYYSVKNSGKPSCGGHYSNNDMVCALSHKRMPKGHGKPCGEKIKVKYGHKDITVKVIDTCASCDKNDIDLSHKAFKKLDKMKKGELKVKWEFQ